MSVFDLDTSLIEFTHDSDTVTWTIRDAVEGVQIFGGIGSGKTSGSGRFIALKFLSNNFGGLILTAKPDEKKMWQQYCRECNREQDLIIVEPKGDHFFNFLEYESSQGSDRSFTENIVQLLKTVIRASEEKSSGKSDDPFWETALDMLMSNTIDICMLAYGKVSVQMLFDIAQSIMKSSENSSFEKALNAAKEKIVKRIGEWEAGHDTDYLNSLDDFSYNGALFAKVPEARLLKLVDQFFIDNFRKLSEKTRSIVDFSFTGFLFHLLKDPVYSLFCNTASTFDPESSIEGKIIMINLPVKIYHKVGRDIQIMFKYIWQRAMEKRDIEKNGRPVFLWADESQNFLHEYDSEYQATARSSRIATVYISQNVPNYYASMGGAKSEYKVKSFLGTLGTKIFHANADIETNNYASQLIGEDYRLDESESVSSSNGTTTTSVSKSLKLDKKVRPEQFNGLATGGPKNNFKVDAYMHVQGMLLKGKANFKKIIFNQKNQ